MVRMPDSPAPLVSVVMPTYNHAAFIRESLESVRAQTMPSWEAIVVNNFSEDDTVEIVNGLGDPRIRLVNYHNNGIIGASRNQGMRLAKGRFLAFLDSDDIWLPGKLARQLDELQAHPDDDWCYSDAECFDSRSGAALEKFSELYASLPQGWVGSSLLQEGNFIASPTVLARRDVVVAAGGFNESPLVRCREDWELWLRLAACHRIAFVPEVLARYREHPANVTRNEDLERVRKSNLQVIRNVVEALPAVYAPIRGRAEALQYLNSGASYAMRGEFGRARRLFARAIGKYPLFRHAWAWLFLSFLGKTGVALKERIFPLPRRVTTLAHR